MPAERGRGGGRRMESVKALENLTFVVRQWRALWRLKRVDTRQRRRMEREGC